MLIILVKVCLICQRYKFKSKSQLKWKSWKYTIQCVWYVKDTNLKANHNQLSTVYHHHRVCLICQRYKFKSKSQQFYSLNIFVDECVWYVKDTNLKANHNKVERVTLADRVCLICQRYKFKSKSQPRQLCWQ